MLTGEKMGEEDQRGNSHKCNNGKIKIAIQTENEVWVLSDIVVHPSVEVHGLPETEKLLQIKTTFTPVYK